MSCDFVGYRLRSLAAKMRAKPVVNAPFLFPLMDLPHELIALVVERVIDEEGNIKDLINLSTTCRLLQSLAEAYIYQCFELRDSKKMSRLARGLARQKDRYRHIRELDMCCDGFVSCKASFLVRV
jgi:hypothetical protein